jgi:hypothetical protein
MRTRALVYLLMTAKDLNDMVVMRVSCTQGTGCHARARRADHGALGKRARSWQRSSDPGAEDHDGGFLPRRRAAALAHRHGMAWTLRLTLSG